jgi:DNA-binding NarL/FixJ family response regulator
LDGQLLLAQVIGAFLVEVMGCEVLGLFDQPSLALAAVRIDAPDVLVLHPGCCGPELVTLLDALLCANPEAKVVLRGADAGVLDQCPALAQHTIGMLNDDCGWSDLIVLFMAWQQGHGLKPSRGPGTCLAGLMGMDALPRRERRMVLELGQGLFNKQIAHNLGLTPATVGTYRKTIAAKLGMSGSELVRCAAFYRWWIWLSSKPGLPGCESTAEPAHHGSDAR